MIKITFDFKYEKVLSYILLVIMTIIIMLGIGNFYKYSSKKEILMQKVIIFLENNEGYDRKF